MRLACTALILLCTAACGAPQGTPPAPAASSASAKPAEPGVTESGIDCPLEQAVYTEPRNGFELRFAMGEPWDMGGMTESIFELAFPDGKTAWGYIASNMGTSRDTGYIFHGCNRPGPDDGNLSEEQFAECLVWQGLTYSLNSGEPGFMPSEGANAPERILMTDLGRKIRYSLVDGPGREPWDVFTFKSCAPAKARRLPGQ